MPLTLPSSCPQSRLSQPSAASRKEEPNPRHVHLGLCPALGCTEHIQMVTGRCLSALAKDRAEKGCGQCLRWAGSSLAPAVPSPSLRKSGTFENGWHLPLGVKLVWPGQSQWPPQIPMSQPTPSLNIRKNTTPLQMQDKLWRGRPSSHSPATSLPTLILALWIQRRRENCRHGTMTLVQATLVLP